MKLSSEIALLSDEERTRLYERTDELMFAMVLQILLECGRPSPSYLQRKLKWPYSQAQRWVEKVCERVPTKQWEEGELPWFDFEEIARRLLVKEGS